MLILTREIHFENDLEISSVTSHMEEKFKSFTELRFRFCLSEATRKQTLSQIAHRNAKCDILSVLTLCSRSPRTLSQRHPGKNTKRGRHKVIIRVYIPA